ncbi:MAG TPA: hypothetical protein VIJ14_08045 [Rhabdochlamydiaceae bacterium]
MESKLVFRLPDSYEAEYGSVPEIRFMNPEDVKFYDGEGSEIIVPKCKICGWHKNKLMGQESFMWLCSNGCKDERLEKI